MHNKIIAIVATIRSKLQRRHNTTRVSIKKEIKEWERINVTKQERKENR